MKKYPHLPIYTTTIPYTNDKYTISPSDVSLSGWVIKHEDEIVEPFSNDRYLIDFFDDTRDVSIGFLVNLTYRPFEYKAESFYHLFDVYHIDGDLSNNTIDNLLWKIPQGGIPTPERPDYNVAPNYELYGISADGRYFNRKSGQDLSTRAASKTVLEGYRILDYGTGRTVTLHRAIAMAFLSSDEPYVKLQVNHIDNDRFHNHLSNLEWVTQSENSLHSLHNHPFGKLSRQIFVKDYLTNSLLVFPSMTTVVKKLRINFRTIANHANSQSNNLIHNRYHLRFKEDANTFPQEDKYTEIAKHYHQVVVPEKGRHDKGRIIVAINIENNQILHFTSVDAAALRLGVTSGGIINYLSSGSKWPYYGCLIRYEDSWGGIESERKFTQEELEVFLSKNGLTMSPVVLTKMDGKGKPVFIHDAKTASIHYLNRRGCYIKDTYRTYLRGVLDYGKYKFMVKHSNGDEYMCELVQY